MILPRYDKDVFGKVLKERHASERLGLYQDTSIEEFLHALLDEIQQEEKPTVVSW